MNKYISRLLRLAVGISILAVLISKVGFSEIVAAFASLDYRYAPLIITLYLFSSVLATINIAILLLPLKKYIPLVRLLKYYILSWGLGLVVPGKLGELSIIYFLKLENVSVGEGSAISLIDKLITFFTLVVISSFALFIYFSWTLLWIFLGSAVLIAFLFWLFVLNDRGRNFIRDRLMKKYHYLFRGFSKTVKNMLKKHKRIIYLNFVLTAIKWALQASVVMLIFKSFGVTTSFINIFIISSATALVSLLPITVNGLGVKESFAAFLYSKVGIPAEIVVGTYLIFIILGYCFAIVFTMLFWKDITKLVRTVKSQVTRKAH